MTSCEKRTLKATPQSCYVSGVHYDDRKMLIKPMIMKHQWYDITDKLNLFQIKRQLMK